MVVHKKNLLDAFRQAAPEGRRAPAQETRSSKGGGPFAGAPRRVEETPHPISEPRSPEAASGPELAAKEDASAEWNFESAPAEDRRTGIARLVADPGFRLIVLVAVLIGAGAFLANRFGSRHVQAVPITGGEQTGAGVLAAGAAGHDAAEKNQAAARMGAPADQAFMNPENRFTVRLAQYNNDAAGKAKAFETADFLRKLAIPVVSPIEKGNAVILVAGAKPKTEDLASLLKTVQAQHGTGGQEKQLPFASAYIQNIDALVQRR
jgi:hypothetical protein